MVQMVEDFTIRIDRRIDELRPLIEEYEQLIAIREALTVQTHRVRRRGRPAGVGGVRRGAVRDKVIAYLHEHSGGQTVREISVGAGINQNYAYALLRGMEQNGLVERRPDGRIVPTDDLHGLFTQDADKGESRSDQRRSSK